MLAEFVNKLLDLAKIEVVEKEGLQFSSRALHTIKPDLPAVLNVSTLAGLLSSTDGQEIIAHVRDFATVRLIGNKRDKWGRFEVFGRAAAPECGFRFDQYMPQEEFLVGLNCWFEPTLDQPATIALISNVKTEDLDISDDNGVSQSVTVKKGIHLAGTSAIPNPVTLAPYRTFREVVQPASKFLLRVKKDHRGASTFALFEADGGAWKNHAVVAIKEEIGKLQPRIAIIG